MLIKKNYFTHQETAKRLINRWDIILLCLFFFMLFTLGVVGSKMHTPYALGESLHISLDPQVLPEYAMRTLLRMFVALIFSLLFAFIVGTIAAKNRWAERIIIPAIDILQSVPVLSFLAITIAGFIQLFPGNLLGPECASIFAVFTGQVWNITLSLYQSLRNVPDDLREVGTMYHLSPWQFFWKIEVPCAIPGLLWNIMVSMSASWFFVVVSESLTVANQTITLPGVGSYIALAIKNNNLEALGYAILTMIIMIFLYDKILFKPLVAWAERFKLDNTDDGKEASSWILNFIRLSALMSKINNKIHDMVDLFINIKFLRHTKTKMQKRSKNLYQKQKFWLGNGIIFLVLAIILHILATYIMHTLTINDVLAVICLGSITSLRVIVLLILSSALWLPIGVFIGMRPHLAQKIQPIIQLASAFPANLFYPLFVIAIVRFKLNPEIWLTPLMILGAQWYILFNVIAGASMIPKDLCLVSDNFGVKGLLWWRRLAFPCVLPYYITGAITAAGGAWNACIVAEVVSWGTTSLHATGLGYYISMATTNGDFPRVALGTSMMCVYVLTFNHLIWRPLYRITEKRFHAS
jgi:NitT/TauT family transport system permease protein